VKICDVSDLTDIQVLTTFNSGVDTNSIPHNVQIKGDLAYMSYYHDGLQVFDISDPANPVKVGYYDTYSPPDHDSYRGAWGVYPFLPSGQILVSDMQFGLFVVKAIGDTVSTMANEIRNITSLSINTYPQPAENFFNTEIFSHENMSAEISLIDITGQEILHRAVQLHSGNNSLRFDLPTAMSPGLYFLKLKSKDGEEVHKIIKAD
jgi:hypothetical protein